MLQTQTVERGTLELLKKLMCDKKIEQRIREMIKFETKIFETTPI